MASNDSNELKKRFDVFLREARFEDKPYRLLGRPQNTGKLVSMLFAYPEQVSDKDGFIAAVVQALKAYGLDAGEPTRQKTGLRVQARLLPITSDETQA